MKELFHLDDLAVTVCRSRTRRTVNLVVDRFGDVVINVPEEFSPTKVEQILRRKQEWIYTKVQEKASILRASPLKEYVTGEGFYFLGKKFRLKLIDPNPEEPPVRPLRLLNGRFLMNRQEAKNGCEHFVNWYVEQGHEWFPKEVDILSERVGARPKSIAVRDLKFRWGSCNAKGNVYFHWRLILLPPKYIRYLIIHELVHLREHNHGPAFYEMLRRVAPDHQEIDSWLKLNADEFVL